MTYESSNPPEIPVDPERAAAYHTLSALELGPQDILTDEQSERVCERIRMTVVLGAHAFAPGMHPGDETIPLVAPTQLEYSEVADWINRERSGATFIEGMGFALPEGTKFLIDAMMGIRRGLMDQATRGDPMLYSNADEITRHRAEKLAAVSGDILATWQLQDAFGLEDLAYAREHYMIDAWTYATKLAMFTHKHIEFADFDAEELTAAQTYLGGDIIVQGINSEKMTDIAWVDKLRAHKAARIFKDRAVRHTKRYGSPNTPYDDAHTSEMSLIFGAGHTSDFEDCFRYMNLPVEFKLLQYTVDPRERAKEQIDAVLRFTDPDNAG